MFPTILLFLALLLPCLGSITPVSTTSSTLLSFGSAHTTQSYLLTTPDSTISSVVIDAPTKSYRPILSNFSSQHTRIQPGVYNITLEFFFESWVGNFDYAVIVDTVSPQGEKQKFTHVATHAVYGMVLYESDNTIVSGDEAAGIKFNHFLTPGDEEKEVMVMTYAPEGVDMTPEVKTRNTFSDGGVLNRESVKVEDGVFRIRPRDYSSGSGVVDIMCTGLEDNGEVYETVVMVSVSGKPAPPAVLVSVNASVVEDVSKIEGVVLNGEGAVLMVNGTVMKGSSVGEERYVFEGFLKDGIYEDLRIMKNGNEGIVNDGLVVEILGIRERKSEIRGKNGVVGVVVICAVTISVVLVVVLMAVISYRRALKMQSMFIDGRPVHIARDVYGRGSLHV